MKKVRKEKDGFKVIVAWVALLSMIIALPSAISAKEPGWPENVSVLSKGSGGYSYPIAIGMARVIEKHLGVPSTVEPAGGSTAELELLRANKAEMAISIPNLEMWSAYYKKGYWKGKDIEVRLVMSEVTLWLPFIVKKSSDIYSIKDLKGKIVWDRLGTSQIMALWADGLYEIYGIKDKVKSIRYSRPSEVFEALKEGRADAIHWPTSESTPGIADLATSIGIRFLPIEANAAEELNRRHPFFKKRTLPANTYKGQDKDVPLVSFAQGVLVRSNLSDSFVYEATKALVENFEDWAGTHKYGKYFSLDTYFDDPIIPYHAGCIKYYKEKGVWGKEQDEIQKRLLSEMGMAK
jgi:TRAP transporter TAXI family solute receptor